MIFIVTMTATLVAALAHAAGWGIFVQEVSVPVAGVATMCGMGVIARVVPTLRAGLVAMVPSVLPGSALVWASGLAELLGGIGVLVEVARPWAAACLALLLVCVFPANVVDAHRKGDADGSFVRRILLRGGEQVVFVGLCLWVIVRSLG